MRLALFFLAACALGQVASNTVTILPTPSAVGEMRFRERHTNGVNYLYHRGPDLIASNVGYTWPVPSSGCISSSAGGAISIGACSGAPFPDATDMMLSSAIATHHWQVSSATAGDRPGMRFRRSRGTTGTPLDVAASDRLGALVFQGYKDGDWRNSSFIDSFVDSVTTSVVSGDIRFHVTNSGGSTVDAMRIAPDGSVLVGTLTDSAWLLDVNGTFRSQDSATFNEHIFTSGVGTKDIGTSGNYFQTLFAKNIEAAPLSVTGNYINIRKLNIADDSGGTNFWDVQVSQVGAASSRFYIRDNAGTVTLNLERVFSSSTVNRGIIDLHWLPAINNTYTLGNTSFRWDKAWVKDIDISGTCTGCGSNWTRTTTTLSPAIAGDNVNILGHVSNEILRLQARTDASNNRAFFSLFTTNPAYWWEFSNQDSSGGGTANGLAFLERSAATAVSRVYFAPGGNIIVGGLTDAGFRFDVQGTLRATGNTTLGGHLLFSAASASDIGSSANYAQTLYIENIDAAPSLVTGNYVKVRQFEIADDSGGTNKWDFQVSQVGSISSSYRVRDNAGTIVFRLVKRESSADIDQAQFRFHLVPGSSAANDDGTWDLGVTSGGNRRWRNLNMTGSIIQNGTTRLDASGNLTVTSCTGCGSGVTLPVSDSTSIVEDNADGAKEMRFEVGGFTSGATRVITPPDTNFTMAGINIGQTFSANQTFGAHILFSAASTWDIGTSANYAQTLYVENIDAAPSSVTGNYIKTRKLEIADNSGGTNFWDTQVSQVGSVSSYQYTRDNAGTVVFRLSKLESSAAIDQAQFRLHVVPGSDASADDGTWDLGVSSPSNRRWRNLNMTGAVIIDGTTGVTASGTSCTITAMNGGVITAASCM